MKKKYSELQVLLTVLFVGCLLTSNIVTYKQISFGPLIVTGGVFVFPITYILSDVFSECYGYRWSRLTCYMAFVMNLIMVGAIQLTIKAPYPVWWDGQEAWQMVLGNTPRVLIASVSAFIAGDFINDKVFERMKVRADGHKGFNIRAILSSVAGEFTDAAIFYPIAFIGLMSANEILITALSEVSLKIAYELIILPVTNVVMKKVSKYEQE